VEIKGKERIFRHLHVRRPVSSANINTLHFRDDALRGIFFLKLETGHSFSSRDSCFDKIFTILHYVRICIRKLLCPLALKKIERLQQKRPNVVFIGCYISIITSHSLWEEGDEGRGGGIIELVLIIWTTGGCEPALVIWRPERREPALFILSKWSHSFKRTFCLWSLCGKSSGLAARWQARTIFVNANG
jgi:hypothetical protein